MQVGQGEMGCEVDGKEMNWDGNGNVCVRYCGSYCYGLK